METKTEQVNIDQASVEEKRKKWACAKKQQYAANPAKYRAIQKKYNDTHKEQKDLQIKKWREKNSEKVACYQRKARKKHYDKNKEKISLHKKEHPEISREATRRWRAKNPERSKLYDQIWRLNNIETAREIQRKHAIKRRSTVKGNLSNRMSCRINGALRQGVKSGRGWESLVGYTVHELRNHIEKKFKKGMDWEKFLNGEIHIDHIIPIKAFNYETTEDIDFKNCWALNNLQPMWAKDNIIKRDKLNKPFQPSLLIGGTCGNNRDYQRNSC
jgi:hypothetical protein